MDLAEEEDDAVLEEELVDGHLAGALVLDGHEVWSFVVVVWVRVASRGGGGPGGDDMASGGVCGGMGEVPGGLVGVWWRGRWRVCWGVSSLCGLRGGLCGLVRCPCAGGVLR